MYKQKIKNDPELSAKFKEKMAAKRRDRLREQIGKADSKEPIKRSIVKRSPNYFGLPSLQTQQQRVVAQHCAKKVIKQH